MFRLAAIALVGLAIAAVGACSQTDVVSDDTVTGIVSEVNGDVETVSSFVVLTPERSSHKFIPASGLTVNGDPLVVLRQYVISGQTVVVTYEQGSGGELIATLIEDSRR